MMVAQENESLASLAKLGAGFIGGLGELGRVNK
jgi:hypothetical protein